MFNIVNWSESKNLRRKYALMLTILFCVFNSKDHGWIWTRSQSLRGETPTRFVPLHAMHGQYGVKKVTSYNYLIVPKQVIASPFLALWISPFHFWGSTDGFVVFMVLNLHSEIKRQLYPAYHRRIKLLHCSLLTQRFFLFGKLVEHRSQQCIITSNCQPLFPLICSTTVYY